jgi:hypothetical protein
MVPTINMPEVGATTSLDAEADNSVGTAEGGSVVTGVESVDVTDIVFSQADYCLLPEEILKRVRKAQPVKLFWMI